MPLNPRRRSTTSPCSPLPWSPCRLTGRPTGFSGHASARTGQAHKAKPRRRSLHEIELPLSLLTVDVAKLSLRSRLANRDVSYIFRRRSRPRDSAQQQAKLLDSQAKLLDSQTKLLDFLIAVLIVLLSNLFFDCSVESFALKPIF